MPRTTNGRILSICLFSAASTFVFSCASSTAVPRRELDRAYTLPDGTKSWTGAGGVGFVKDDSHSPPSHAIYDGNPLIFEHSISDNWTAESNPIPYALRHQILNSDSQRLGARLGSPIGYGNFQGLIFYPFFELDYLYRASSWLGWRVSASATHTYSTSETIFDGYGYGIRGGPIFQLDETKTISPKVGAEFSSRQRLRIYDMNLVTGPNFQGDTNAAFPLQLSFNWSLSQSWGASFLYSFEGFTAKRNYRGSFLFLDIHYFWTQKLKW